MTIAKEVKKVNKEIIARKLIELRGGKTQEKVAADLNISTSALSMYERGERIPRDEIKIKIANYYNRTVEAIFFKD